MERNYPVSEILEQRYACGEINREEHVEKKREMLRPGGATPTSLTAKCVELRKAGEHGMTICHFIVNGAARANEPDETDLANGHISDDPARPSEYLAILDIMKLNPGHIDRRRGAAASRRPDV